LIDKPHVRTQGDKLSFNKLHIEPAYKQVSKEIQRFILSGRLPLGSPLPTEQVLADRFGVHRSTVREAIRRIENEGLVQRRAGRRLFVASPGLRELAPRAARLLLMQQTTFEELWQTALALEPLASQLAAQHADSADLKALAENVECLTLAQAQPTGMTDQEHTTRLVELDVEFHALVAQASHNRALALAREPVSLLYRPSLQQIHTLLPQSKARNLAAHRAILKALRARNAQSAADWTRRHIIDFKRGFALTGLSMDAPIATFQ